MGGFGHTENSCGPTLYSATLPPAPDSGPLRSPGGEVCVTSRSDAGWQTGRRYSTQKIRTFCPTFVQGYTTPSKIDTSVPTLRKDSVGDSGYRVPAGLLRPFRRTPRYTLRHRRNGILPIPLRKYQRNSFFTVIDVVVHVPDLPQGRPLPGARTQTGMYWGTPAGRLG